MNKKNTIFVDWNKGADSWADMALMSMFKNIIISNSTFSWWAAWLNDAPDKIILAPSKWINNKDMDDVYTDRMTKIAI